MCSEERAATICAKKKAAAVVWMPTLLGLGSKAAMHSLDLGVAGGQSEIRVRVRVRDRVRVRV